MTLRRSSRPGRYKDGWKMALARQAGLVDLPTAILPAAPRVKATKPRRRADDWSLLKEKLDREFSLYIRRRDSFDGQHAICVTCGNVRAITGPACIQAGHYQSRRFLPTRWDSRNAAPQCAGCNCWGHGENERMAEYIDKRWGVGTANDLRMLSRHPWRPDVAWMKVRLADLRMLNGGKSAA